MVSKVLSQIIRKAKMGSILGFSLGKGEGVTIFHLQFADDTMIFCDAVMRQMGYLRCILKCFEVVSGLKINLQRVRCSRLERNVILRV